MNVMHGNLKEFTNPLILRLFPELRGEEIVKVPVTGVLKYLGISQSQTQGMPACGCAFGGKTHGRDGRSTTICDDN
jgi:hypothetical protein